MSNEAFWRRRARREAWRFNFAWWLQTFLPWLIGVSLAGAAGVIALRTSETGFREAAWIFAAVLAAGLPYAWLRSRKKFLTATEALTRLDADLHLHNRLTAATSGIGSWPERQRSARLALRWRANTTVWPPLLALALLVASFYIPLPGARSVLAQPAAEPPAWTSVQEKLTALRNDALARPEVTEALQAALDALRQQPSERWYQQASLEAGDHLQQRLEQGLSELKNNLEHALGAMEAARQLEQAQMDNLAEPLQAALQEALKGLETGSLPVSQKDLAALQGLDLSEVRQLSAAEWQALKERLQAGAGQAEGAAEGQNGQAAAMVLAALTGIAPGEVGRGRNDAPLTFQENETRLGTNRTERAANDDLSRAALGDLQRLDSGEHKIDESAWEGPQAGGSLTAPASGGDAVWDQTATPDEQAALKRFFR